VFLTVKKRDYRRRSLPHAGQFVDSGRLNSLMRKRTQSGKKKES